jgi:hypothetical protein
MEETPFSLYALFKSHSRGQEMGLACKFRQTNPITKSRGMFLLFLSYYANYFGLLMGPHYIFSIFPAVLNHWPLLLDFSTLRAKLIFKGEGMLCTYAHDFVLMLYL